MNMTPYIKIMKKICEKYDQPEISTLEFLLREEEAVFIQEYIVLGNSKSLTDRYFLLALGRINDAYKHYKK